MFGQDKNLFKNAGRGSGFPIKPQLMVLALIIVGLFAGVIVPKTVALFDGNEEKNISDVRSEDLQANVSFQPKKIESLNISGKSAFVWDVTEQRVLYEKNPDTTQPLASITKLMTALVAYELVPNSTPVTVSERAARQESGGNLSVGEQFEIKDLADFALISSYNSAAYTLADSVGALLGDGDPVTQFVDGMNIRAKELNLNSLEFLNPTGLDISDKRAGAFGSARDVTFLMEYILKNHPQILSPTIRETTRFYNRAGDFHDARNTNIIVYDIPNLRGSKTGFTDLAGGNLTIAFDAGYNHPIIITVLGSTYEERFTDVETMVKAVQDSFIPEE